MTEQEKIIAVATSKWKHHTYNSSDNTFHIETETKPAVRLEIQGELIYAYYDNFREPPPALVTNKLTVFELLHVIVSRLRSFRQLAEHINPPAVPELKKMSTGQ